MKEVLFNEKKYNIPEQWSEVTIRQVIDSQTLSELMPEGELIAIISTYCGIPVSELKISNLGDIDNILTIMKFINVEYVPSPTNEFTFKGEKYGCLPDLREQEFQDWLSIQNILYANRDYPERGLARMIGVYCKRPNESLDDFDLNDREKLFMELPITVARDLSGFFLNNLQAWRTVIQLYSQEEHLEKLTLQSFRELSSIMKLRGRELGWYSPTRWLIGLYRIYLGYLRRELEKSFSSKPIVP